jgi:hypothetical protein
LGDLRCAIQERGIKSPLLRWGLADLTFNQNVFYKLNFGKMEKYFVYVVAVEPAAEGLTYFPVSEKLLSTSHSLAICTLFCFVGAAQVPDH